MSMAICYVHGSEVQAVIWTPIQVYYTTYYKQHIWYTHNYVLVCNGYTHYFVLCVCALIAAIQ